MVEQLVEPRREVTDVILGDDFTKKDDNPLLLKLRVGRLAGYCDVISAFQAVDNVRAHA